MLNGLHRSGYAVEGYKGRQPTYFAIDGLGESGNDFIGLGPVIEARFGSHLGEQTRRLKTVKVEKTRCDSLTHTVIF